MEVIKAIIIDDERLARSALKQKLLNIKQVEVLAEADSVDTAIEQIKNTTQIFYSWIFNSTMKQGLTYWKK